MITGLNTNVEQDGRSYHVQTEDRGLENPVIESLVYLGGRIVASRRFDYRKFLDREDLKEVLPHAMRRLHSFMIEQVNRGGVRGSVPSPDSRSKA